jgi:CrcB protein
MNETARQRVVDALLVGGGGFLGAVSRHGIDLTVGAAVAGIGSPLGTLAVNVAGSFALGALTRMVQDRRRRLFLATGLLSSFTTYSTFAVETAQLGALAGAMNVIATYGLGILAAIAGVWIGRGEITRWVR